MIFGRSKMCLVSTQLFSTKVADSKLLLFALQVTTVFLKRWSFGFSWRFPPIFV
jgi:hypothetical protein